MSAPVFAAARDQLVAGRRVVLDGSEGHHAATVRRLGVGERVLLTDGAGVVADSVVVGAERDRLTLDVESVTVKPAPSPRLVVVQALPKGDRGETAVETLTEVGVDMIVPWSASRCVTAWKDGRGAKALERWRSTGREASKQSRRSWWVEVAPLASTADVAGLLGAASLGVVLHESAADGLASVVVPGAGDVVLVVGPEGGLTAEELASFARAGVVERRLGETVLRTSTAGTVGAAVLLGRSRWV